MPACFLFRCRQTVCALCHVRQAGFLRANVAYGMARPDLREGLRAELKTYLEK
jgi:hypothetical protein